VIAVPKKELDKRQAEYESERKKDVKKKEGGIACNRRARSTQTVDASGKCWEVEIRS
jgi:hypothetical protein